MRLIDADELINIIKTEGILGCGYSDSERESDVIDMINNVPAIEPKRGTWVKKHYVYECANETTEERNYVMCSECGKQPPSGFGQVNFCHNCGAKIDKE